MLISLITHLAKSGVHLHTGKINTQFLSFAYNQSQTPLYLQQNGNSQLN